MPTPKTKHHKEISLLITRERMALHSDYLERPVEVDVYVPRQLPVDGHLNLLLINDGQDLVKMEFEHILHSIMEGEKIEPLMCVGIHCGPDRNLEYGTVCQPNYKGLGCRSGLYNKFIFDELLPFLRKRYNILSFKQKSFAGFSMGGLSALDIVWNHANEFAKVGVFSGSLWWRRKAYEDGYDNEKDRIMHMQVRNGGFYPWLKFYFQTGWFDETADRNNNGIIDSIDDALDMIVTLKAKGYNNEHICYCELEDGRHDVDTWARALPAFILWGWKKTNTINK